MKMRLQFLDSHIHVHAKIHKNETIVKTTQVKLKLFKDKRLKGSVWLTWSSQIHWALWLFLFFFYFQYKIQH